MAVPTSFSDLSTTAASNSPSGSETPAEGDNHFRIGYAFLRSIMDNSGNGWVSPYWALTATSPSISAATVTWSGNPTHSGNHTFSGNVTVQGNTTLGNGTSDTTSTTGAVTMNPPASGRTLTIPMGSTGLIAVAITADANQPAAVQLAGNGASVGSTSFDVFQGTTSIANLRNRANTDMEFDTNNTKRFVLTSDGRIYGTAIHNNAGAVTGTTNQYIARSFNDNTTITATAGSNVSSTGTVTGHWVRNGNFVYGVLNCANIDPTSASTATTFTLNAPITGMPAGTTSCSGTAVRVQTGSLNCIAGSVTGGGANTIQVSFLNDTDTAARDWVVTFGYTITS